MPRLFFTVCALLLSACGAADGALVENPQFDDWVDGGPKGWEVEGEVAPVVTWHAEDLAVSFLSTGAQITQSRTVHAGCFQVDSLADVEPAARLTLYVKFDQVDGIVPYTFSAVGWKNVQNYAPTPAFYQNARFIVRKEGPGRAVLARLQIYPLDACPGEESRSSVDPE